MEYIEGKHAITQIATVSSNVCAMCVIDVSRVCVLFR